MIIQHIRKTIHLSIPIIIGQLGQMAMSVADNIMVGHVGTDALAAASIGNALFTLIMVVGIGISMAITPLTAMAHGRGMMKECGKVLRQGLAVNMVSGILLCCLTFGAAHCIVFLNQPSQIVGPAVLYMQVLGFSMIPLMLFQSFRQFAEGISVLRPAMVFTLLANILNIFVNWVFIYGNLGAPALGLTGAGIATFSSRTFMAIGLGAVILKTPSLEQYDPGLWYKKFDMPMVKKLLKIGIPGAGQYFFEVSAFAASSIIVGWMGAQALAAHQIALNLASISFMGAMGISAAGTIRVGNAMGRNSLPEVRAAGFSAVLLCCGFMVLAGMVFILFRSVLTGLYVSDETVLEIACNLMIIVAFFQVSDGTQAVGIGILRGITDMKIPTLLTLAAYWIIGLPSGCLLAFYGGMGIYGIWIGLLVSLSASALLMMLRFHFKTRKARA